MELNEDKEKKKYEMIGSRFIEKHAEVADFLMNEWSASTPHQIAQDIEIYLTKTFATIEEEIKDEFDDWCDQYDAKCDPQMDESNYLKREI